ncbi:HEAT repeat domain-containing protein [Methylobacterium sp. NEAU 140]|uniref:DNA alkylation repair protein n=1 Tax=Methylobacterium sp. NEAU 140 TaxID=3064945 RepID=UPI002736F335|nr:HEAT repeat domain-containing protein [Methylobacterium sp. NEAU 140]MDP4023736.1 HEAT repeat domain-containing protein [Methylobacterium sp. NEAU 140]
MTREREGRRAAIDAGAIETRTLAEILAVDFGTLLGQVVPAQAGLGDGDLVRLGALGISARMAAVGRILLDRLGPRAIDALGRHRSDTVRGWACFMIGARDLPLPDRLAAIRPYADDDHFGVREWAWLAVRPAVAARIDAAMPLLGDWTADPSDRVRRFASEATRPRGVWCAHIAALKADPSPGLPLLEPLRADPSAYVQDSVGNWLNDAAKSRPDWVRGLVAAWCAGDPPPSTRRIARRALRSIDGSTAEKART